MMTAPPLVGILISAGSILYIIFQLYFDWMHHHSHMKATHQTYWTMIHLPFHIALVLLAEGGSQWAVWWRGMEAFSDASTKIEEAVVEAVDESLSTSEIVDELMNTARDLLSKYGSDVDEGGQDANRLADAARNLLKIPDSFWTESTDPTDPNFINWSKNYLSVTTTVMNAIADAFDLSVEQEKSEKGTDPEFPELEALAMTGKRLRLIVSGPFCGERVVLWLILLKQFVYMFIAAGLVLILLMLMAIVSKRRGWSIFNLFRTGFVFAIGVSLCLISLISLNPDSTAAFLETPWPLPTILICFLTVLVVTHLPHPPRISFKRVNSSDVELANVPATTESEGAPPDVQSDGAEAQTEYRYQRDRQTMGGIEGLHAQLPGHYDVGRPVEDHLVIPTSSRHDAQAGSGVRRGITLRRGLTTIQRAAKSIHFEGGGYDPIAEGDLFFQGGNSSPITSRNLYSV